MITNNITKEQLASLMRGYWESILSLDSSVDGCAEDLWLRLQSTIQDAGRYDWLRSNNATVLECTAERRGFRSTAPNATRETWTVREGWTVNTLSVMVGPYFTMDDAVDAAREAQ